MDRWYGRLFEAMDRLSEWPDRFPIDSFLTRELGRETRKMNFDRYLVSYQVDHARREVRLAACVHGPTRRER